jgi:nucleotidyltransferase/DNA polymerase involved in DNA repair
MESSDEEKLLNALVIGEDTATLIARSLESARKMFVSHYIDREEQTQELLNQAKRIHLYLQDLPVEKVWGIGPETSALLAKRGVHTALQFARRPEAWVKKAFTKPTVEIWMELNGKSVIQLETKVVFPIC